jgi:hypothetical protein
MRSLSLRPGNSLTIPRMALSMGFRYLVSLLPAIQATELHALTLTGLTPVEHTSLGWTHNAACGFPALRFLCYLHLKGYVTYQTGSAFKPCNSVLHSR